MSLRYCEELEKGNTAQWFRKAEKKKKKTHAESAARNINKAAGVYVWKYSI